MPTQPNLPFSLTHSRRSDPDTSRRAASNFHSSGKPAAHKKKIMAAMKSFPGGCTPHDIAKVIGLDTVQITRRRIDLLREKRITVGPDVRDGFQVWRVA